MRNFFLLLTAMIFFAGCSNNKEKTASKTTKSNATPQHTITKEGLGDLKIGMLIKQLHILFKVQISENRIAGYK